MPTNAERLFNHLRTPKDVQALKGQTEDGDFDCKEWHGEQSTRQSIAKSACGFTNATGGVIVVGMIAKAGNDGVDVVQEESPVDDAEAVRSKVEDIISKLVEPGIEGIQSKSIRFPKSKSGFVVVFIPESEGSPHRSTAPKDFFVRIGPNTIPMAYFQIADRFGRRPQARLIVEVRHEALRYSSFREDGSRERVFSMTLTNEGRGIARFPAVRFQSEQPITVGNPMILQGQAPLWPISDASPGWLSFRGGANDVVYPGEIIRIATLIHAGHRLTRSRPQEFHAMTIRTEAVCEGMPAHRQSFSFGRAETVGS
jgi:Putative DNA-binding domain